MTIYEKLVDIQDNLKAPKNQRNTFGNYNYRSCEDILEAVKPLLKEHKLFITISDHMVQFGDRYYVSATAFISDGENSIHASALAREALTKKGMDEAQITGSASSYARKYALNGLFAIDDTKDADAQAKTPAGKPTQTDKLTPRQSGMIMGVLKDLGAETDEDKKELLKEATGFESIKTLTKKQASEVIEKLTAQIEEVDLNEDPFGGDDEN
jgi:hypothetical protein